MKGKLLAELAWLMWIESKAAPNRAEQARLVKASMELALRARRAGFRGASRSDAFAPSSSSPRG
jgi:hypothetical protein